jgi:hypothetical protein
MFILKYVIKEASCCTKGFRRMQFGDCCIYNYETVLERNNLQGIEIESSTKTICLYNQSDFEYHFDDDQVIISTDNKQMVLDKLTQSQNTI